MDLCKVRKGNYLKNRGKLVEVDKVICKKDIVFVDGSSEYLLHYEVTPALLENKIKFDLIGNNLSDFPKDFTKQFYELVFGDNLFLHDVQNIFEDMFGWKLKIDLPTFCKIQQSIK